MPIETAPITDHGYFFARIAWGPDEDKSTGDGVRHKGEWHAAALFYRNGQDRQYGFSEHRVVPTHWKPHDLFQTNAEDQATASEKRQIENK